VLFCDGSAQFVRDDIDEFTVEYLVRIADNETLGEH
jgi:hypothetical protein